MSSSNSSKVAAADQRVEGGRRSLSRLTMLPRKVEKRMQGPPPRRMEMKISLMKDKRRVVKVAPKRREAEVGGRGRTRRAATKTEVAVQQKMAEDTTMKREPRTSSNISNNKLRASLRRPNRRKTANLLLSTISPRPKEKVMTSRTDLPHLTMGMINITTAAGVEAEEAKTNNNSSSKGSKELAARITCRLDFEGKSNRNRLLPNPHRRQTEAGGRSFDVAAAEVEEG